MIWMLVLIAAFAGGLLILLIHLAEDKYMKYTSVADEKDERISEFRSAALNSKRRHENNEG